MTVTTLGEELFLIKKSFFAWEVKQELKVQAEAYYNFLQGEQTLEAYLGALSTKRQSS